MPDSKDTATVCQRRVTAFKGHLTRAFKSCDEESKKTPVNAISIQFCISKVNTAWSNYEEAFNELELIQDLSDETYQAHADLETKYQEYVIHLQTMLQSPPPQPILQPTVPNVSPRLKGIHLEIPKFNGDRKKWPVFWATFKSLVHENKQFSNILKFTYLQEALKGEAADRIQGFTGIDNEYSEAIDLLIKVYADQDAI